MQMCQIKDSGIQWAEEHNSIFQASYIIFLFDGFIGIPYTYSACVNKYANEHDSMITAAYS